ncbi:hypothetical protein F66182_3145 [Fusarium sp. NRRL 66182]|nr:hypothetical protein F66182_3145 [Fusarium sp. NRRL 66182]
MSTKCQTCCRDFKNGDALSAHLDEFGAQAWLLSQQHTLCRYHISKEEFDAWLLVQEFQHDVHETEFYARRLSEERLKGLKDTKSNHCQCCKQSFETAKELEHHVMKYMFNSAFLRHECISKEHSEHASRLRQGVKQRVDAELPLTMANNKRRPSPLLPPDHSRKKRLPTTTCKTPAIYLPRNTEPLSTSINKPPESHGGVSEGASHVENESVTVPPRGGGNSYFENEYGDTTSSKPLFNGSGIFYLENECADMISSSEHIATNSLSGSGMFYLENEYSDMMLSSSGHVATNSLSGSGMFYLENEYADTISSSGHIATNLLSGSGMFYLENEYNI